MPTQDAQGRWISDDGLQYWDGTAWRPIGAQAAPRRGISALPAVLIGCGFALVIVLVIGIGLTVFALNSPDFQRSFCNGWNSNNSENSDCPFHPSP
jgi:hypothetical protein